MVPSNPTSLEEAFDLVRQKPLEEAIKASSNPFERFMLDLAKVVKEEKKSFIPKKAEVLTEDLIEETIEEYPRHAPIHVEEAMSNLAFVLEKARAEAQYKLQQEAAVQQEAIIEEELILEDREPLKPLLATSLEGVLARLAEAIQTAKEPEKEEQEEEEQEEVVSSVEPTVEKKPYVPPDAKQNNPYVNELIRATKNAPKIVKGSRKKADIKKLIAEQIHSELETFRRQLFSSNLMMGGGGGGTNAVQYAAGGTMNGDLNVNGRILSGGIDISEAIKTAVSSSILDSQVIQSAISAIVVDLPAPSLIDGGPY